MPQIRKTPAQPGGEGSRWVSDPMARLLFKAGPPAPALQGVMPPFPFESLEQMRATWLAERETLLPALRNEMGGDKEPWAERTWGDGSA
ncbi:MAG: hypothetical protein JWL73_755 [Actinomycetia bacterium]|nr:hypothetical protein [Actinomycetes bacterium]